MPHAPDEVPIRRGYAALALCEYAHVSAEARPACRRRDDTSCLDESPEQPLLHRLKPDALRGGDHYCPYAVRHLASAHHLCGDAHVGDASVRARSDDNLVDGYLSRIPHRPDVGRQMRERDDRFETVKVDLDRALVFGGRVCLENPRWLCVVPAQISKRLFVHGEDAVLRARLDRHVGDGEAVVHRQIRDPPARELQRLVARAVNAYHAYQVQDYVLAAHPFSRRTVQHDLYRGGDAEPSLTGGHPRRHVRRSHARRERTERTVCACVRICADHEVARRDKTLLRQKRMLDAAVVSYLEVVCDSLLLCERPHRRALGRRLDVLVGREVVWDERNLPAVEHVCPSELRKLSYRDGRGDVVAEDEVEPRHDKFPRAYGILPRMGGENLLRHRHVHFFASSMRFTATSSASIEPSITSVETPRPR